MSQYTEPLIKYATDIFSNNPWVVSIGGWVLGIIGTIVGGLIVIYISRLIFTETKESRSRFIKKINKSHFIEKINKSHFIKKVKKTSSSVSEEAKGLEHEGDKSK